MLNTHILVTSFVFILTFPKTENDVDVAKMWGQLVINECIVSKPKKSQIRILVTRY